jgi:hypothetical protein
MKSSACYLRFAGSLLDLFFSPENGGDMFLQNYWLTFNRPHGKISQETGLLHFDAVGIAFECLQLK